MGWYLSDSLTYKNLELSLLQNDSFYFSIDAPFIRKNKGKWEVRSIDGLNYAFLNYDTTEYAVIDDKINFTLGGSIYFHSLRSKNGQPVIEYAFFKRVK